MPPRFAPRKLLVAAVGVATLNYLTTVACTPSPPTSGNLPAPTAEPDARPPPPTSGNLMVPPTETAPVRTADASMPTAASALPSGSNRNVKPPVKPPSPPTAGNLMAPQNTDTK